MDRGATAAVVTELGKTANQPVHLVAIEFDEGWIYMTDSYKPITWDGHTWLAVAYFLGFSDITESATLQVTSVTVSLSGVDQVYVSAFLSNAYLDRQVLIYKAFMDTANISSELVTDGQFALISWTAIDYTGFTEADAPGRLSVDSASQITITALDITEAVRLTYDHGVGTEVSGDFYRRFKVRVGASVVGFAFVWGLGNDDTALLNNQTDFFAVTAAYQTGALLLNIYASTGGTAAIEGLSADTDYYVQVRRSGTTAILDVFSDSSFTTLIEQQTAELTGADDFRYEFGMSGYYTPGPAPGASFSGVVSTLVDRGTTAAHWTEGTGWAIDTDNGKMVHTAGSASDCEQDVSAVSGQAYRVEIEITITASTFAVELGGETGDTISATGHYVQIINATTDGNLKIKALTTDSAGYVTKISVVRLGYTGGLVTDPLLIFDGRIDAPVIEEDPDSGKSTLSIKCSDHWADFERIAGRRTNHSDQQLFYPGDKGFEFADQSVKSIKWGRA